MNYSSVENHETLARFVLRAKWVREDRTIRQDAFMPASNLELSVTRHYSLAEDLWNVAATVAQLRRLDLLGRADVKAQKVRINRPLDVHPAPINTDFNHANIVNWPENKAFQKMSAIKIAADSVFIEKPKNK